MSMAAKKKVKKKKKKKLNSERLDGEEYSGFNGLNQSDTHIMPSALPP
jgi:hypothetical protein